jgi:RHH-type transcriptional regulator, rel operon repressor / antitoxin RelB
MVLTLSQSIEERLGRLTRHWGLSKTSYARQIILKHIEDQEDIYDAEGILRRVHARKERIYTLDEVARRLGLDH